MNYGSALYLFSCVNWGVTGPGALLNCSESQHPSLRFGEDEVIK